MIVGTSTDPAATSPLYVMNLATRRAAWASTREAAIAGNIANANTPDYKARDIEPFAANLHETRLQMAATSRAHLALSPIEMSATEVKPDDTWDVTHSANTVSLDEQLLKADETQRSHQLSLSVLGTFHRMLMTSVSFR
ncbi:flagellar basal body rod protein FlgB [Acuticoccus sp. M5D2P5]|uniref:flagellar basal body rod protein FlgB n=1 Tax=Acuticoccus kalidii TaxID=2910977 RepID=UPI001F265892|nr:flagellar basal body rod protein FlgB [Acuticoccus kalidii]MCF3932474.1 flagellar basal body rod protein FlgB [Acuticoccus kalidii]